MDPIQRVEAGDAQVGGSDAGTGKQVEQQAARPLPSHIRPGSQLQRLVRYNRQPCMVQAQHRAEAEDVGRAPIEMVPGPYTASQGRLSAKEAGQRRMPTTHIGQPIPDRSQKVSRIGASSGARISSVIMESVAENVKK